MTDQRQCPPASEALSQVASLAEEAFAVRFGRRPQWAVAAPGRVNLIGEHVDYNDGVVLPMAVDRHIVIAAAPATDLGQGLRVYSAAIDEAAVIGTEKHRSAMGSWSSYMDGVVHFCAERGIRVPPLDLYVHSNLPSGSGLSSSAALEVSTATLLEAVSDQTLEPWHKIKLCQRAEHEWAGVPCGIMDQATVVLARAHHVLKLDCRSLEADFVSFEHPDVCVLITNSNVRHKLADSPYAQRRAQCEKAAAVLRRSLRDVGVDDLNGAKSLDEQTRQRARHVVTEIARVEQMANAIDERNWEAAGQFLYASHRSLREDYEVSCAELDVLVEAASTIGVGGGVYGSRMTGAGFGGCTVSLVESSELQTITNRIAASYEKRTGIVPEFLVSRPTAGACALKPKSDS